MHSEQSVRSDSGNQVHRRPSDHEIQREIGEGENSASRKRHTGAIPSLVDDKTNIKENLQKLLDVTKNKEDSSEEPSEVNDIKEDGKKNDADENEQLRKLHNKVTPPQRTSSSRNGSPHTTRVRISRARSLSVSSGDDSENEKDTSRAARVHKTEHKDGDLHEKSSASGAVIGKLKIVVNKETYEDDTVNEIESIQEKMEEEDDFTNTLREMLFDADEVIVDEELHSTIYKEVQSIQGCLQDIADTLEISDSVEFTGYKSIARDIMHEKAEQK